MYWLSDMSPGQPPGHGGGQRWSGLSSSASSNRRNCMPSYAQMNGDRRDTEIVEARNFIFRSIYEYLVKCASHFYGIPEERKHEVAECLEETLFNNAASLEEYLNQDTLLTRLEVQLIGRFPSHRISEYGPIAIYDQSNMIPDSLFSCNETSMTESETLSELHARQMPAQPHIIGGQNDIMMQRASFTNSTDISFSSRDQTSQFPNDSVNIGLGNVNNNMVHANGPDVSETKFIQTACNEPDQLRFGQHHQTAAGDRYELCSSSPPILENHHGSTNSLVWVKNDRSSNASGMHMQCQSNRSSLMPHYLRSPHPEEALAIQPQVLDQSGNITCSMPLSVSDTLGKLRGYDVHLNSQYQPQQNYTLGMLETTTSGNGHMKANEVSSHAEYPNQSDSQHLANENASPMQVLHHDQLTQESESEYQYVNNGIQPKEAICSPKAAGEKLDASQPFLQVGSDDDFKNRDIKGSKKVSKEGNLFFASETASVEIPREPTLPRDATGTSWNLKRCQLFLLGLCHAHNCTLSKAGECLYPKCMYFRELLGHISHCKVASCPCPGCPSAKTMITHFRLCKHLGCRLCVPVKRKFVELKNLLGTPSGVNHVQCNTEIMPTVESCVDLQRPPKRAKTDVLELCIPITEKPLSGVCTDFTTYSAERRRPIYSDDQCELIPPAKLELKKLHGSSHADPSLVSQKDSTMNTWDRDVRALEKITQENVKHEEIIQTSIEHDVLPADPVTESMTHPKVDCVSLTELFTPEQIKQHIISLRQWAGQSKVNADQMQSMEQCVNQNSCQLCAAEELNFEPRPVYCAQCGSRIKRDAVYYMLGAGDTRYFFCTTCHTAIRGKKSVVCGITFSKCELEKKMNNEHIQEPWVQCDNCQGWQHQICALFNSRMNGEGQAKYTCPNCYVKEIERGDRLALPQTAFLRAKDLQRTALSDHIERRLSRRLQDRRDTNQGPVDEKAPGGGDLVVRVVLSVDKKLEVKKNFLETFQGHAYPAEFPYKSKVILLFQDIEGVDVCLFGMYVQEFGSECDFPNRRRVYISYLDSVKYFRPNVKLMSGESLRTFVYHEVLIGYLEHCKIRGFTSCYIWVCPPPKGEDYLLYCHPESQKTPKKDKLRQWYLSMLKKAVKEDIVVGITNLYDHFLISAGESKAKITAARLPYFDGDYWPSFAEAKLQQFCKEGEKAPSKKSATKKPFTKRSRQTTLRSGISDSASKDMFLISKIGKEMCPMKEDFIMVHLQHACSHCCMFIISGNCWLCEQCSDFRLCDKCYKAELYRDKCDRHPSKKRVKHLLHRVKIPNIPSETKDMDGNIESEIFDTRHGFLNFSEGNHYQNDTLRRAKHSSMMLLYHIHNPTIPAYCV